MMISQVVKKIRRQIGGSLWLYVCFAILVLVLFRLAYGRITEFYFWRDDTYFAWAGTYFPNIALIGKPDVIRLGVYLLAQVYLHLLGFNLQLWQSMGMVLKLVNIVLLSGVVYQLSKSKKQAAFAAIFYAVYFGGLEAYSWTILTGMLMSFIMISLFFYLRSFEHKEHWSRDFVLALAFAFLTLTAEFGRGIAYIGILIIWEFFSAIFKRKNRLEILVKRLLPIIVLPFFYLKAVGYIASALFETGPGGSTAFRLDNYIPMLLGALKNYDRFLGTIGNLLKTPYFPIYEEGALSTGNNVSYVLAGLLFLSAIVFFYLFVKRKKVIFLHLFIFTVWIPAFYLNNWLYGSILVLGPTHRYIAISSLAIPIIYSYIFFFLDKHKKYLGVILLALVVILNLKYSMRIVEKDYSIRGRNIVEPIWNKIASDVPLFERRSVFNVSGDHYLIGYIFHWGGPYPYGLIRGITSPDELPVFLGPKKAGELLCDPKVTVWDNVYRQERVFGGLNLNRVHAWRMNEEGRLINTTDQMRFETVANADCLQKEKKISFSGNLTLQSVAFIDKLDEKGDKAGVVLKWLFYSKEKREYEYAAYLENSEKVLSFQRGKFSSLNTDVYVPFTVLPEDEINSQKGRYFLRLNVCPSQCPNNLRTAAMSLN